MTTRARVAREAEAEARILAREAEEQIPIGEDFVPEDIADEVLPDIGDEEVDQTVPPVVQPPPPEEAAVPQMPRMTEFFQ